MTCKSRQCKYYYSLFFNLTCQTEVSSDFQEPCCREAKSLRGEGEGDREREAPSWICFPLLAHCTQSWRSFKPHCVSVTCCLSMGMHCGDWGCISKNVRRKVILKKEKKGKKLQRCSLWSASPSLINTGNEECIQRGAGNILIVVKTCRRGTFFHIKK